MIFIIPYFLRVLCVAFFGGFLLMTLEGLRIIAMMLSSMFNGTSVDTNLIRRTMQQLLLCIPFSWAAALVGWFAEPFTGFLDYPAIVLTTTGFITLTGCAVSAVLGVVIAWNSAELYRPHYKQFRTLFYFGYILALASLFLLKLFP